MKIVIFAGGVGTRLWPLSRKNSPKQFERILGDRSTLQETVERLLPRFDACDIYIATGRRYEEIVRGQLPEIPKDNFILEPEMRDVGPAIGLIGVILEKISPHEPLAILWSDHLVKNSEEFRHVLAEAESILKKKNADLIFIAQKPRFANQNMGWIELGEQIENNSEAGKAKIYHFKKLKYRPTLDEAQSFFKNKEYVWNLGYFVTTPETLVGLYQAFVPQMYAKLLEIKNAFGTKWQETTLDAIYPTLEKISFDDAILVKLKPDNIYVISSDLGWSDVGAWEALKEALCNSTDENATKGNIILEQTRDSLIFNYTDQLVVGIDLNEMLVINTADVVLICPKTSVPKIKKLVENLSGTPHEHLT